MDIKNATYKSQMEIKNATHNFKPQINIKTKHIQKKKPYTLRGILREGTLIIAVSEFIIHGHHMKCILAYTEMNPTDRAMALVLSTAVQSVLLTGQWPQSMHIM